MKIRLILLAILAFFALSSCDPDAGAESEPLAFGTSMPPVEQSPLDQRIPKWTLRVTYLAQARVVAPQGLPDGYYVHYHYTFPAPVVVSSRKVPEAQDITFLPEPLMGVKHSPILVEVLSVEYPSKREQTKLEEPLPER
jgi:hypothetical protein